MKLIFTLLLTSTLAWQILAQSPVRSGKDYALFFVGTDFDQWPDLPGSDKTVREIAKELETAYGFRKAEIHMNLKKVELLKVLTDYQTRTFDPGDQLLVYFSMHGHFDEAIGALIPKDGLLHDPSYETWILHPVLEAYLSKINCEHILLALDACYSGTFGQNFRNKPTEPAWENETKDCAARCKRELRFKSRLYLTSGGKERTPADSELAKKWLEALRMRNTDGLLTFPKLYSVLAEAIPQPMQGDFKGHEIGGGFVFVHQSSCTNTASAVAEPSLEEERNAWRQAKAGNTADGYYNYLKRFPRGLFAEDAREALAGLEAGGPPGTTPMPPVDPGQKMVLIKGSSFRMGDLFQEGNPDERPAHDRTVRDFLLDVAEVTFEDYTRFCREIDVPPPSDEGWGQGLRPVINVSWYDAIEYCNWRSRSEKLKPCYTIRKNARDPFANDPIDPLKWSIVVDSLADGYRLPTEAEWEFAARQGGQQVRFGNGKLLASNKDINFNSNPLTQPPYQSGSGSAREQTMPVRSYAPNSLGVYDLCGNAAEWCWDWKQNYPNSKAASSAIHKKIVRGGHWGASSQYCRAAYRGEAAAQSGSPQIGFRCARNAPK